MPGITADAWCGYMVVMMPFNPTKIKSQIYIIIIRWFAPFNSIYILKYIFGECMNECVFCVYIMRWRWGRECWNVGFNIFYSFDLCRRHPIVNRLLAYRLTIRCGVVYIVLSSPMVCLLINSTIVASVLV